MTQQGGSVAVVDAGRVSGIDRYFRISERGSTVRTEVRGGLATFFTMAYIVVLNPIILAGAVDVNGARLDFAQVAASTALVAAVMTLLMGVVGRMPIALAAGLGLNTVVAFQLAGQMSWPAAMGIVVMEGVLITLLVLFGLRAMVFDAIPMPLKQAISVGIGLFIAFIGFVDGGFARRTAVGPVPVNLGIDGRLLGWPTVVFAVGLLVTGILVARKVRGAILIGIVATTIFAIVLQAIVDVPPQVGPDGTVTPSGWGLNVPALPDRIFDTPDFGLLGHFSIGGSFDYVGVVSVVLLVFTLMLSDFFDTMGTVVGIGAKAGLLDDKGRLPNANHVLLVDSLAAAAGGAASCSSNTSYIESAAGVSDGARTGFANLIIGGLFLLALFISPLASVVPYEAASPALVIVGFLLMTQVRDIPWDDFEIALPAFLTIILMPFTYSITNGIGAGFVSYVAIKVVAGKAREVHWLLWVVAIAFVAYFAIAPIEDLLGVT
jgi:AGZA family xanthine/uracil permease-like MFS transporter